MLRECLQLGESSPLEFYKIHAPFLTTRQISPRAAVWNSMRVVGDRGLEGTLPYWLSDVR